MTLVTLLVIPGRWRYCRSSENCRIASISEDERNRDQLYDLVTGSGPAWFNAIRTSLPFFPASSREVMGFSYHRLDCLVKDRFTSPIRARIVCNAKANWNGSRTDSARANGLPGALTRQKWPGPRCPVYVLMKSTWNWSTSSRRPSR